jgi:hypothetical protein
MKTKFFFCVLLIAATSGISYSQAKIDSTEITSSVPELSAFHEIIFPMWHKAYPAKDIKTLKGYVPQIKTAIAKINTAKLPGILRDKESAWKNQLTKLNASAENYYKAAEGNVDSEMLNAAEDLHRNYEMMYGVIRPLTKEIDDYHQSLYVIYHKLYPEKKYNEIAQRMDNLVNLADLIVKYPQDKLKTRLGENTVKYESASKALYAATLQTKDVLKGNDNLKKDEAVQNMHSKYQQLEEIFKK